MHGPSSRKAAERSNTLSAKADLNFWSHQRGWTLELPKKKGEQFNCFSIDPIGLRAAVSLERKALIRIIDIRVTTSLDTLRELEFDQFNFDASFLGNSTVPQFNCLSWACQPGDHDCLLASSVGNHLILWSAEHAEQPFIVRQFAHSDVISSICWSTSDANMLCTVGLDSVAHIWDVRDHIPLVQSHAVGEPCLSARWSHCADIPSSMLAVGSRSHVSIFDTRMSLSSPNLKSSNSCLTLLPQHVNMDAINTENTTTRPSHPSISIIKSFDWVGTGSSCIAVCEEVTGPSLDTSSNKSTAPPNPICDNYIRVWDMTGSGTIAQELSTGPGIRLATILGSPDNTWGAAIICKLDCQDNLKAQEDSLVFSTLKPSSEIGGNPSLREFVDTISARKDSKLKLWKVGHTESKGIVGAQWLRCSSGYHPKIAHVDFSGKMMFGVIPKPFNSTTLEKFLVPTSLSELIEKPPALQSSEAPDVDIDSKLVDYGSNFSSFLSLQPKSSGHFSFIWRGVEIFKGKQSLPNSALVGVRLASVNSNMQSSTNRSRALSLWSFKQEVDRLNVVVEIDWSKIQFSVLFFVRMNISLTTVKLTVSKVPTYQIVPNCSISITPRTTKDADLTSKLFSERFLMSCNSEICRIILRASSSSSDSKEQLDISAALHDSPVGWLDSSVAYVLSRFKGQFERDATVETDSQRTSESFGHVAVAESKPALPDYCYLSPAPRTFGALFYMTRNNESPPIMRLLTFGGCHLNDSGSVQTHSVRSLGGYLETRASMKPVTDVHESRSIARAPSDILFDDEDDTDYYDEVTVSDVEVARRHKSSRVVCFLIPHLNLPDYFCRIESWSFKYFGGKTERDMAYLKSIHVVDSSMSIDAINEVFSSEAGLSGCKPTVPLNSRILEGRSGQGINEVLSILLNDTTVSPIHEHPSAIGDILLKISPDNCLVNWDTQAQSQSQPPIKNDEKESTSRACLHSCTVSNHASCCCCLSDEKFNAARPRVFCKRLTLSMAARRANLILDHRKSKSKNCNCSCHKLQRIKKASHQPAINACRRTACFSSSSTNNLVDNGMLHSLLKAGSRKSAYDLSTLPVGKQRAIISLTQGLHGSERLHAIVKYLCAAWSIRPGVESCIHNSQCALKDSSIDFKIWLLVSLCLSDGAFDEGKIKEAPHVHMSPPSIALHVSKSTSNISEELFKFSEAGQEKSFQATVPHSPRHKGSFGGKPANLKQEVKQASTLRPLAMARSLSPLAESKTENDQNKHIRAFLCDRFRMTDKSLSFLLAAKQALTIVESRALEKSHLSHFGRRLFHPALVMKIINRNFGSAHEKAAKAYSQALYFTWKAEAVLESFLLNRFLEESPFVEHMIGDIFEIFQRLGNPILLACISLVIRNCSKFLTGNQLVHHSSVSLLLRKISPSTSSDLYQYLYEHCDSKGHALMHPDSIKTAPQAVDFIILIQKEEKEKHELCSICKSKVSGSIVCCSKCSHGGHMGHIKGWFSKNSTCPVVDCECECAMIGY